MEIQYYGHTCTCGCGGKISIKKYHKWYGIPKYIKGHYSKINNPMQNKHHSEETKQKQANIQKGKKFTEEHIQNLSEAKKGELNPNFGKKFTEEHRYKISISKLGKKPWNVGIPQTDEVKQKISKSTKGELSCHWQNGKSFEPYAPEFNKDLKQQILERDNYICQCPNCIIENITDLHIHHIDYDKKNNNPENLITLCNSCHTKTNGKNKRHYFTEFYQNIMINRLIECLL